jgi:hypothetical protein
LILLNSGSCSSPKRFIINRALLGFASGAALLGV